MTVHDRIIIAGRARNWTGPHIIALLTLALDENWTAQTVGVEDTINLFDRARPRYADPWQAVASLRSVTAAQFPAYKARLHAHSRGASALLDMSAATMHLTMLDIVRDIQIQLRGPNLTGWSQLGTNERGEDLTLVDAFAAMLGVVAELREAVEALQDRSGS